MKEVRELVRDNNHLYYQSTGAVQGPCGAIATVLSRHGWGRIACGYYGFWGQDVDQLNAEPPVVVKDWHGEIVDTKPGKDNWQGHWVNVNKFSGVIDVSGAYLEHRLAEPIYRKGHLIIADSIVHLKTGKKLWSRKEIAFWEWVLSPVLRAPNEAS